MEWLRYKYAAALLALLVLCFNTLPAFGQQDETIAQGEEENRISTYPGLGSGVSDGNQMPGGDAEDYDETLIFPDVWCEEIKSNDETAEVCWEAYRAGLAYYEWGLDHRKDVLWWQHISTRAIFFVVLILVGVGLYFAWVQFRSGPMSETPHEVQVSMDGIKVSSPVLGVIILTLSLAFFYLYLRFVYPVQEII